MNSVALSYFLVFNAHSFSPSYYRPLLRKILVNLLIIWENFVYSFTGMENTEMYNLGAQQQQCAMKSYRRHLQKQEKRRVHENEVGRKWVEGGLSRKWRENFNRHNN